MRMKSRDRARFECAGARAPGRERAVSVKVECRVCGDTYKSIEVERVISWSKSHDDSCKEDAGGSDPS